MQPLSCLSLGRNLTRRCTRVHLMLDSCQNYSKIKNIKEKIKSTSNDDGENLEYGDSDGYELEGDASSSFSGRNLSLKKLAFLKDPLGKGVDNFNSSHLNELFECCITHLSAELGRIRTGRATPGTCTK